ncbi:MAG: glycosyltransferase [Erysipelotrichaceae bacterium]|jgi:1,2-diacylglycerol-3-alpha-glucose alpha-1,2-glucosyltransferase|nr:glycosyltransferase [Erysipelotrichaceae bacterium]
MKVCLYFEGEKVIQNSGVGRAMKHQMAALASQSIEYTTDPSDDYDILHINTIGPSSASVIRKARQAGKKIIYHAHSTEEDFRNSFMLSNQLAPLFKKHIVHLYSQADHIITPTPYSKKLLEGYGISVPIEALSNGIDIQKFSHDEDKIKKFREYFHLLPEEKVVISVGLYFDRKGILDFVEVAKALPSYKFIWFGYTPLYSIPKNIRQVVTKHHPDNVLFPGYVKGAVIEGAYAGADVFFFPSKEETEGIVVLEALASYQQIVLRDIPVFDPWMVHGKNCFKGCCVEDFIQLVYGVVEKQLPSLREAGRKTAEQRSIPEVGKRLRQIYEQVLSS